MSVIAKRLSQLLHESDLSQERLGINAGLDEMSASTRVNRYVLGKRVPDFALVEKFAKILNAPTAFFYATKEEEAQLLLKYHRLDKKKRQQLQEVLNNLSK